MDPAPRLELVPGLRALMYPEWRGGAFAEVLDSGRVAIGDEARWEVEPVPSSARGLLR